MGRDLRRLVLALSILGLVPSALATGAGADRAAKGRLLIASRALEDPNFARSVVLLLAYDDGGAMGIVVNHPTRRTLAELSPELGVPTRRADRLHLGGPVLRNALLVLVRAPEPPQDAERVFADVHLVTSRQAVQRTLQSRLPRDRVRVYAGHAGWGPGQLDAEITRGDWRIAPGDPEIVFSEHPDEVWPRLIERAEGQWAGSSREDAGAPGSAGHFAGCCPAAQPSRSTRLPSGVSAHRSHSLPTPSLSWSWSLSGSF